MSADFTPSMEPYKNPQYFRFWCQKVLPLVYDDSLSYYELLCKVVNYLNDVIADSDAMKTNIGNLLIAYNELQDYVNHYFDSLDVQAEINNKLDAMAASGELLDIIEPTMSEYITQWLDEHITPTSPAVDSSLTVAGAAADAKVTGDNFKNSMMYRASAGTNDADELQTGIYVIVTSHLPEWSHLPDVTHGVIIHSFVSGNNGDQIAVEYGPNITPSIYRRSRSSGVWGDWIKEIDASLTVSGSGADAKVTGDNFKNTMMSRSTGEITDANELETGLYVIVTSAAAEWSNLPRTDTGLIIESFVRGINGFQLAYTFLNTLYPVIYYRAKSSDAWGAWYTMNNTAYVYQKQAVAGLDANDFEAGTCFCVTSASPQIANLPFTRVACLVKTFELANRPGVKIQTVESWSNNYTAVLAIRNTQGNNNWLDWSIIRDENPNKALGFTVITDSLGSGTILNSEGEATTYYELSWPAHLARKHGLKYYISGASGQSAVQWVDNNVYGRLGLFARLPKTPLYFITLGVNDANQGVSESDFKAAYRTIINSVKEKQPNAVIICVSLFRDTSPWAPYSGYIQDVAASFSGDKVYYMDVTNDITTDPGISAHLYSGHYDVIGYALIGDLIESKFLTLANNHPAAFRQSFANMITSHPNSGSGYPFPY